MSSTPISSKTTFYFCPVSIVFLLKQGHAGSTALGNLLSRLWIQPQATSVHVAPLWTHLLCGDPGHAGLACSPYLPATGVRGDGAGGSLWASGGDPRFHGCLSWPAWLTTRFPRREAEALLLRPLGLRARSLPACLPVEATLSGSFCL